MKHLSFSIIILITTSFCSAQRLTPVLQPGDTFPFHAINGEVYCMIEWNGLLIAGGNFTEFKDVQLPKLLAWDGQNVSVPGGDLPFADITYVTALGTRNDKLLVGLRSAGDDFILEFDGNAWTQISDSYFFGSRVVQIASIGNTIYAAADQQSELYVFQDGTWSVDFFLENNVIVDIEAYNGELFVCSIDESDFNICRYANSEFIDVAELDSSFPRSFYSDGTDLYACGEFVNGDASSGLLKLVGGTFQLFSANVPEHILSMVEKNGSFYTLTYESSPLDQVFLYVNDHLIQTFWAPAPSALSFGAPPICLYNNDVYVSAEDYKSFVLNQTYQEYRCDGLFRVDIPYDRNWLDGLHVHAKVDPTGSWFRDADVQNAAFLVPGNSSLATIYSSSLWVSALKNGEPLAAWANFEMSDDGWCYGPICDVVDLNYANKYYQTWNVTKQEVNNHLQHFNDVGYTAPVGISLWPGNGNTDNGEAHILAPFIDQDNDGWYEPHQGDVPDIDGDESMFMILNDRFAFHQLVDYEPMNIELQVMFSTFSTDVTAPLDNAVFAKVHVFNRSENDYEDLRLSIWNDYDLGAGADDYIGVDSLKAYSFVYNGDNVDSPSSSSLGYGESPPAQACILLGESLGSHRYYFNSQNPNLGEPETTVEFYNYARGFDLMGQPGISNFMFSGNVCDNSGDTELNGGYQPGDRRSVMSSLGHSLMSGDYICFNYAYYTALDTTADNFMNACALNELADYVVDYYNDNISNNCALVTSLDEKEMSSVRVLVYPNPGHDLIEIVFPEVKNEMCWIECYDAVGHVVFSQQQKIDSSSRMTLNMESLACGLYEIKLSSGKHVTGARWLKQ